MSISTSSDIVLGVAKAADPQKYQAALEKLTRATAERLSAGQSISAQAVEAEMLAEKAVNKLAQPSALNLPAGQAPLTTASTALNKNDSKPFKDFEAFFLQTFVEAMLPKDAESLFGSGPAGKIWKSMLAEHLANELAKSTAFGIAETIAENRKEKKQDPTHSAVQESGNLSDVENQDAGYLSDLQKLLSSGDQLSQSQSIDHSKSPPVTRG